MSRLRRFSPSRRPLRILPDLRPLQVWRCPAVIEERCVRCGELIVAARRSTFLRRYTDHVVEEHDKPATVDGGARVDA